METTGNRHSLMKEVEKESERNGDSATVSPAKFMVV